jgi:drug/metabolite transporter (DMT)-like permease
VIEIIGSAISSAYSPYQTVWIRYGSHLLLMAVLFTPSRRAKLVYTPRPGMQLFRSLLMFGMPVCFITALGRMPVDMILAIFWVSPLLATLLSVIFLKESVSGPHWLAAIAAFVGVLLILKPDSNLLHWTVLLPLGMALCFSMYLVLTRLMHSEDTLTSLFYTAGGVFCLLSFGLPLFWQPLTLKSGLLMVSIGLIGFLVLYTLDKSLELAPVSVVAPFAYTQPIWLIALAYILVGYLPDGWAIIGMLIVASSAFYLIRKS